jgi:hypothetical protein
MRLIRFRGHVPKGGYDVPHDDKSVGAVARDLDSTESALRHWQAEGLKARVRIVGRSIR